MPISTGLAPQAELRRVTGGDHRLSSEVELAILEDPNHTCAVLRMGYQVGNQLGYQVGLTMFNPIHQQDWGF